MPEESSTGGVLDGALEKCACETAVPRCVHTAAACIVQEHSIPIWYTVICDHPVNHELSWLMPSADPVGAAPASPAAFVTRLPDCYGTLRSTLVFRLFFIRTPGPLAAGPGGKSKMEKREKKRETIMVL
eukprot:scaffold9247_cov133-Isochrysis_galbana.AAC.2